jgi:biopolymer transport protein ExbD
MTATYKVRHEGSPNAVGELTLPQVVEGLQDGLWEPTDEVMGPDDAGWVPIEDHPALAEVAADIEPPPPKDREDETRLDFTPLIDVCLVLLIFFMIITTYSMLQKRLEQPDPAKADPKGVPIMKREKLEQQTIPVTIRMENGKPVIRLNEAVVDLDAFPGVLAAQAKAANKNILALQYDDDVPHGVVVAVQDAAAGARLEKIFLVVPPEPAKR